jgi:hypothetical protein
MARAAVRDGRIYMLTRDAYENPENLEAPCRKSFWGLCGTTYMNRHNTTHFGGYRTH